MNSHQFEVIVGNEFVQLLRIYYKSVTAVILRHKENAQ